jgi:enolase
LGWRLESAKTAGEGLFIDVTKQCNERGASTGENRAVELRDKHRFLNLSKGGTKAVANANRPNRKSLGGA